MGSLLQVRSGCRVGEVAQVLHDTQWHRAAQMTEALLPLASRLQALLLSQLLLGTRPAGEAVAASHPAPAPPVGRRTLSLQHPKAQAQQTDAAGVGGGDTGALPGLLRSLPTDAPAQMVVDAVAALQLGPAAGAPVGATGRAVAAAAAEENSDADAAQTAARADAVANVWDSIVVIKRRYAAPSHPSLTLPLLRIASGCVCCMGSMPPPPPPPSVFPTHGNGNML